MTHDPTTLGAGHVLAAVHDPQRCGTCNPPEQTYECPACGWNTGLPAGTADHWPTEDDMAAAIAHACRCPEGHPLPAGATGEQDCPTCYPYPVPAPTPEDPDRVIRWRSPAHFPSPHGTGRVFELLPAREPAPFAYVQEGPGGGGPRRILPDATWPATRDIAGPWVVTTGEADGPYHLDWIAEHGWNVALTLHDGRVLDVQLAGWAPLAGTLDVRRLDADGFPAADARIRRLPLSTIHTIYAY